jgi:hypothetical protein
MFGDLQVLIQGGAVGIALVMLLIGYRLGKDVLKLASNHLEHIAESLGQLNAKMDRLISTTERANRRTRAQEKKRADSE